MVEARCEFGQAALIARAGRSDRTPLTFSRHAVRAPAAFNAWICGFKSWPWVLTLA
jgi:hypothetical protein